MRAARSADESIMMCSSSAWAPAPRGPRPSRVGNSQSRREVAVAAAAGRSFGQLEAQASRAGELAGFLEQGRVGWGALHRRPVERTTAA